jgi:2'-5' RNA ligase
MRLFTGLALPSAQNAELAAALAGLDLGALRLVPPEQRHATLAFYGEVPADVVPELTERLERAARRTPPLRLRLSRLGAFPKPAAARVLWAGLDGDVATLRRLAERCAAAGSRSGVAMESRAYRPHVTIGRARNEPLDLREVIASPIEGTAWAATSFALVHSLLGPQAVHTALETFGLGGSQRE